VLSSRNTKGQSRMDNPETLVILGAQNTKKKKRKKTNTKIQNTSTQKTKKMSNTDEPVNRPLLLCVCFVDRYLSFYPFSVGHCVVLILRFTDSDYPFGIFKLFL
jgi:hypothetical protein